MRKFRVGTGFDIHRLGPGDALTVGGVRIPHDRSLVGHSDADVLLHAIVDALLGACGLGNIGEHFPDSDPTLRGAPSVEFLKSARDLVRGRGFRIGNIDSTILAERPKLQPHLGSMQGRIAGILEVPPDCVHIKAKTMEGLGEIGRDEAIAAEAVVLVYTD